MKNVLKVLFALGVLAILVLVNHGIKAAATPSEDDSMYSCNNETHYYYFLYPFGNTSNYTNVADFKADVQPMYNNNKDANGNYLLTHQTTFESATLPSGYKLLSLETDAVTTLSLDEFYMQFDAKITDELSPSDVEGTSYHPLYEMQDGNVIVTVDGNNNNVYHHIHGSWSGQGSSGTGGTLANAVKYMATLSTKAERLQYRKDTVEKYFNAQYSVGTKVGVMVNNNFQELTSANVKRVFDSTNPVSVRRTIATSQASWNTFYNGIQPLRYTQMAADNTPKTFIQVPLPARFKATIGTQCETKIYHVTVHHYAENTTTKVAQDPPVLDRTFGQSYTTSAATAPDLQAGYELISTPSNATGTITGSDVTVIYYYKLKQFSLKVNYEDINGNTLAPSEITNNIDYGTAYNTDQKDIDNYEFVETTGDATSGTMTSNKEVTYVYKLKTSNVNVKFTDCATGETLRGVTNYSGTVDYGTVFDASSIKNTITIPYDYNSDPTTIPNPEAVTISEDSYTFTYCYDKKDSNVTHSISKTGTERITSASDTVSYTVEYNATISSYNGSATVTVVDTLPYHINTSASNLKGGTYNADDKTITWTDTIDVNSNNYNYNFAKTITVVFTDIDTLEDVMTNEVNGKIKLGSKTVGPIGDTVNTALNINGTINVRYVDTDDKDLLEPVSTTEKVGQTYSPVLEDIEGYRVIEKPENDEYTYTEEPQNLKYVYERILLHVVTRVDGVGGTIKGDEDVYYGDDSTKDKIVIKAADGYVIKEITINGKKVEISKNSTKMILSNFPKMTENKLVVVKFEKTKPISVIVPNTVKKAILIVLGLILIGTGGLVYYLNKNNLKFKDLIKKVRKLKKA